MSGAVTMELAMAKNYFVSYDLNSPGQDYGRVKQGIAAACAWYISVQKSFFYISSNCDNAQAVYNIIRPYTDENDRLAVVEASAVSMNGLPDRDWQAFHNLWATGTPSTRTVA
jgi:hypothetical protein